MSKLVTSSSLFFLVADIRSVTKSINVFRTIVSQVLKTKLINWLSSIKLLNGYNLNVLCLFNIITMYTLVLSRVWNFARWRYNQLRFVETPCNKSFVSCSGSDKNQWFTKFSTIPPEKTLFEIPSKLQKQTPRIT